MRVKKIFIIKLVVLLTFLPLMFITACSGKYDELLLKLKNQETFIGYIGSENCPGCEALKTTWNDWLKDPNWDEGIRGANKIKINRYSFVAPYDAKGAADSSWNKTFFETSWVKNTFEWLKTSQKNLYENNDSINKIVTSDYLPEHSIPMIFFVKEGKYRWFINKWGEPSPLNTNDMNTPEETFKKSPAYNKSTLKRFVLDFIIKDFSDFYKLD